MRQEFVEKNCQMFCHTELDSGPIFNKIDAAL